MRLFAPTLAAGLLALVLAVPAQAEKWVWFKIKGGAVGYDADSVKTETDTGKVGADTLTFYEEARPLADGAFHFRAERLEFECRGSRHRWTDSAALGLDGRVLVARENSEWIELGPQMGSAGFFKRVLCTGETPPDGKEAATFDAVLKAITAASDRPPVDLAALAYPIPKTSPVPTPTPAAPKEPAPAAAAPKAANPLPAMPAAKSPAPKAPTAAVPPPVMAALAPAAVATPPAASGTAYPAAPRCVVFKQRTDLRWNAVNSCAYRVSYAWCVVGGRDPSHECGGPMVTRYSSSLGASGQETSAYAGGLGREQIFTCRAPGIPQVRETAPGRYDYACKGPPAAGSPPAAKTTERPLPKLRPTP